MRTDLSLYTCYIAEPSLLGDPFRRDSRYSGSSEPPLLSRLPWQAPLLPQPPQPPGSWIVEDDTSRGNLSNRSPGIVSECQVDRQRGHQNSISHITPSSVPAELSHINQVKTDEVACMPFVVYDTIIVSLF